jgi:uncharacterized protein YdhG (YjbR/CyaY superfamily)
MTISKPTSIDEYITGFPKETQAALREIRAIVKKEAPEAEEVISYDMPTFRLKNQYLIHFAAFKKHIGLYPAPTANDDFSEALSGYKTGKGSVQLPLDKPMPAELIISILRFNKQRILAKAELK